MRKGVSGIFPNDCLVTNPIVSSSRNLIEGSPLTPINFSNLCNLIEALVLHERVIMTIPTLVGTPLEPLLEAGIITATIFKDATPLKAGDRGCIERTYKCCLEAINEASTFGRGIIDAPDSYEIEQERALRRLYMSSVVHGVQSGAEIEPGEAEAVEATMKIYNIYKDYVDSVYDAARYFRVPAYTGATELFLSLDNAVRCVPRVLYDKLRELHHEQADRLMVEAGYQVQSIPPFALMVLSQCKSRDDIVSNILKVREEFRSFRETCTSYAEQLDAAQKSGTQKDIINIQRDFDRAIQLLTSKITAGVRDTRFIFRVWDVLKAAKPWGIAKNLIDKSIEASIEQKTLARVDGLMDVWNKLVNAPAYNAVLQSNLFPNEYDEKFFGDFREFVASVQKAKGLPAPFPG